MTPQVPEIRLNLKTLALMQGLISVLFAGGVFFVWGLQLAASFAIGSGLMLANLLLLVWIWSRVLAKKSVALTMLIIVVKYSVLLGAIFFLAREAWFHVLSAGLGIAVFIMSALIQVGIAKWE